MTPKPLTPTALSAIIHRATHEADPANTTECALAIGDRRALVGHMAAVGEGLDGDAWPYNSVPLPQGVKHIEERRLNEILSGYEEFPQPDMFEIRSLAYEVRNSRIALTAREPTCETPADLMGKIRRAINQHSRENESHTPDYILANYVMNCLDAFELATKMRDSWHGFKPWGDAKYGQPTGEAVAASPATISAEPVQERGEKK